MGQHGTLGTTWESLGTTGELQVTVRDGCGLGGGDVIEKKRILG